MACLKGLLGQRGGVAFGQELLHLELGWRLASQAVSTGQKQLGPMRLRVWGKVL